MERERVVGWLLTWSKKLKGDAMQYRSMLLVYALTDHMRLTIFLMCATIYIYISS